MTAELPPPIFIAGAVGLDFLNTTATPVHEVVDWISNGEDYLAWLHAAGLVADGNLEIIRKTKSAKELDQAAAQARNLREWFREFVLRHQGRKLPGTAFAELDRLNEILQLDELHWEMTPNKPRKALAPSGPIGLVLRRRWSSSKSLLLPVAEAMAKLICSADFRYVKHCEGETCTLVFLDETRRRARRWCSMAVCGNRAKQAKHRERVKRG